MNKILKGISRAISGFLVVLIVLGLALKAEHHNARNSSEEE